MKKKTVINLILLIVVLLAGFILSIFSFINSIQAYSRFEVAYDKLKYEQLTFEKYEVVQKYKTGTTYAIYFEEYEAAFCIGPITQKKLNKTAVKELSAGKKIEIYYRNSNSPNYIFDICEMKDNDNIFLALEDYQSVNQNNQIIGMIVSPIMFGGCCVLLFIIIKHRDLPSTEKGSRWV